MKPATQKQDASKVSNLKKEVRKDDKRDNAKGREKPKDRR